MSRGRTVAVLGLVLLLLPTVTGANLVIAGHRTVLDPGFVTDALAEDGAYEILDGTVTETLAAEIGDPAAEGASSEILLAVADRAVTPAYVRSQAEANVDRTYAYLHGERDTLDIRISTAPVVENVTPTVVAVVRERPLAALLVQAGAGDEFATAPVNRSLVERLEAGPAGYREARGTFRATVRETVVDATVERAFEERSTDELLALVVEDYDPDDYTEAEKERLVDDRRGEIDETLRERILEARGDEIDELVDDRLAALVAEADAPDDPETMAEAGAHLRSVVVRGFADEGLRYETFDRELAAAKGNVGAVVGREIERQAAAELGDELSLTREMDAETNRGFETARTIVGALDVAGIALPILALVIVALLWLVTRSVATVATTTGGSLLGVGLGTALAAWIVEAPLRAAILQPGGQPSRDVAEIGVGVATRVLATLQAQSLALAVVGALLLGFGLAVRYGYVDRFGDGSERETRGG